MSPLRRPATFLRPATLPRLAPSPAAEPPYDEDRTGGDGSAAPPYVQGTLTLLPEERVPSSPAHRPGVSRRPATEAPPAPVTRPPGSPAAEPAGAPAARPAGSPATRPSGPAGTRPSGPAGARPPGPAGARPSRPPGAVPDERWLRALAQALAEILAGRRPPATVSDHLTAGVRAGLAESGRTMPCTRPPRAGRAHVSRPEDGVVEMCAVVDCGDRSRVLALRLERRGVRWLCVEVETTP